MNLFHELTQQNDCSEYRSQYEYDILGNLTYYVGMAAGGKVGVSTTACSGISYCFGNDTDRQKFLRKVQEMDADEVWKKWHDEID